MGRLARKNTRRNFASCRSSCAIFRIGSKHKGLRVIIMFEGRDAAGKGGTIRALTERVSPRVFRLVALPAPSDREKSQMYMQRYMAHFPAAGEIVIFDRSWYNRAGVEYVMGFCTKEQHDRFLKLCPEIETLHRRRRHPAHQDLARSQRQGAETPVRGADRRSDAPMETQPDGPAVAEQVVRIFPRPGHDAQGDRHQARTVVHPAFGRQEARPAQLLVAHILSLIPYKKVAAKEGQTSETLDEARLRRRSSFKGTEVRSGEILK